MPSFLFVANYAKALMTENKGGIGMSFMIIYFFCAVGIAVCLVDGVNGLLWLVHKLIHKVWRKSYNETEMESGQ